MRDRSIDTLLALAAHLPPSLWDVLFEQAAADADARAAVRERPSARAATADAPTGAAEPLPAGGPAT